MPSPSTTRGKLGPSGRAWAAPPPLTAAASPHPAPTPEDLRSPRSHALTRDLHRCLTRGPLAAAEEDPGRIVARSPQPCPVPPACWPSRPAFPTASSTSASRTAWRPPPLPAWPWPGLRPVVAVYSTIFSRSCSFDQANLDVGLHGCPVVFVLDRAGITGDDGPSHHSVSSSTWRWHFPSRA